MPDEEQHVEFKEPPREEVPPRPAYIDPSRWVRAFYILSGLSIVVYVLWIPMDLMEENFLGRIERGEELTTEQLDQRDALQGLFGLVLLVVIIPQLIVMLKLLGRLNHNARALTGKKMAFSPGWAVGSFFVPIVSAWWPYQAVREIWKVSGCGADAVIGWWWVLEVICMCMDRLVGRLQRSEEVSTQIAATQLSMLHSFLAAFTTCMTIYVVSVILGKQQTLRRSPGIQAASDDVMKLEDVR